MTQAAPLPAWVSEDGGYLLVGSAAVFSWHANNYLYSLPTSPPRANNRLMTGGWGSVAVR